ncbi:hypothetical protein BH10PSE19_BH10PSE19_20390 [soil metagenome]
MAHNLVNNAYFQKYIVWQNQPPFNGWHSWDSHPWKHPWLTRENLSAMKCYSQIFREKLHKLTENIDTTKFRFGFCGNIANNLYLRTVPLRKAGMDITNFLHPQDTYVMSQPQWEEFDGILQNGETDINRLIEQGVIMPTVSGVECHPEINSAPYTTPANQLENRPNYLPLIPYLRYGGYLSLTPTLEAIQIMDALLTMQVPFMAYLSGRPYITTQMGGDIWIEAARGDQLGALQRESFANAKAFLVSNPWSFAHARRYGFRHMIYLPLILDQNVYSPGEGNTRSEWEASSGGSFFVLTTSRLDEAVKGSSIALDGVAAFLRAVPEARFVVSGWGKDRNKSEKHLEELGIADKVIWLPLSGKARLRDYLRSADCFIDQFVLGYFGSAGLEAMACGLPMISRIEHMQYEALCETGAPPVLNAENSAEVTQHLIKLAQNSEWKKEISSITRQWFVANHGSERWIKDYRAMLVATALNYNFSFEDSPLMASLSHEEREYHANELANAPIFPNYI